MQHYFNLVLSNFDYLAMMLSFLRRCTHSTEEELYILHRVKIFGSIMNIDKIKVEERWRDLSIWWLWVHRVTSNGITQLRCRDVNKYKCPGTLCYKGDLLIHPPSEHSHQRDVAGALARKLQFRMDDNARQTVAGSTRDILIFLWNWTFIYTVFLYVECF